MDIRLQLDDPDFIAGVVVAHGVSVAPSPAKLAARIDALVVARASEGFPPPAAKEAIRQMLRRGGFKPSGRNKPASEYLAQSAREGRFPRINNLVDVNNLLSLETGLPISLLDLAAVTDRAELRYGREGEQYVFNPAGQAIDLKGLICVCRRSDDGGGGAASVPLGNAIKDSMEGKLKEDTRDVVGVVYGSRGAVADEDMRRLVTQFGELLEAFGGAERVETRIVSR